MKCVEVKFVWSFLKERNLLTKNPDPFESGMDESKSAIPACPSLHVFVCVCVCVCVCV